MSIKASLYEAALDAFVTRLAEHYKLRPEDLAGVKDANAVALRLLNGKELKDMRAIQVKMLSNANRYLNVAKAIGIVIESVDMIEKA